MVGIIPLAKHEYKHGASNPREEALLKANDASDRQTMINKAHSGGSKGGQITVPQVYTGSSSDGQLNKNIAQANKAVIDHEENSKYDKLAISNKIGGRRKQKRTKKTKKTVRKTRKTKRHKNTRK